MSKNHERAILAANNNADLCAAIMAANGLATERDEIAYFCIDEPLPYYPKLVTLDPNASSQLQRRIEGVSGIKDSFSCLDETALRLKVAFDASWIWWDGKAQPLPPDWIRIETADQLSDWHQAWQTSPSDQMIFPPKCLQDPNLAFFARLSGTKIEAGCLANLSDSAVGMSNVFSTLAKDLLLFEQCLAVVSTFGNRRPVTGYEQGANLDAALQAGFEKIGPLRLLML